MTAALATAALTGAPQASARADDPPAASMSAISATGESVSFPGASGDVADDVAIWRNPTQPDQSLVLADNKADDGGVAVYRLDGSLLHYERTGKIGNIDLRPVGLNGGNAILVGANDRSNDTLRFWTLDPAQGTLTSLEARSLSTLARNYGFCLGHDASYAHTYAFTSAEGGGSMEQYELWLNNGRIDAAKVRTIDVGSQAEGCAVDDATGSLYVGEEVVGIWRYDVDPASGSQRTAIDQVGTGHVTADVEGLTVLRGPDRRGVIIASSQGNSTFAVYGLDGSHPFLGTFRVSGSGGVDDVTETDGLAADPGDFGPSYPRGLLVVHDAVNSKPGGGEEPSSNLKFVRLDQAIAFPQSGS